MTRVCSSDSVLASSALPGPPLTTIQDVALQGRWHAFQWQPRRAVGTSSKPWTIPPSPQSTSREIVTAIFACSLSPPPPVPRRPTTRSSTTQMGARSSKRPGRCLQRAAAARAGRRVEAPSNVSRPEPSGPDQRRFRKRRRGVIADRGAAAQGTGLRRRARAVGESDGRAGVGPWEAPRIASRGRLFGAVRRRTTILRGWRLPAGMVDGSKSSSPSQPFPAPPPRWRSTATACSRRSFRTTPLPAAPFSLRPPPCRSRATPCWPATAWWGGVGHPANVHEPAGAVQRDGRGHHWRHLASIGTCAIPSGLLAPGDRVESASISRTRVRFGLHLPILWGAPPSCNATPALGRPGNGAGQRGHSGGRRPVGLSIVGHAAPFSATVAGAADAYTNGLTVDFRGMLAQTGEHTHAGELHRGAVPVEHRQPKRRGPDARAALGGTLWSASGFQFQRSALWLNAFTVPVLVPVVPIGHDSICFFDQGLDSHSGCARISNVAGS